MPWVLGAKGNYRQAGGTYTRSDDFGADVEIAQRFELDRELLFRPAAL